MILGAYRALTGIGGPLIEAYLSRRARQGREDPARAGERRGRAGRARPPGPLVWLHAASVGEATSVLPLVERLIAEQPGLNALVTTGTVTSAKLLAGRLPAHAIHQYVPVDRRRWARRFLDHWRPDLAIWVESELWPNLVIECHSRGVPMLLMNGRVSVRSQARWRRAPTAIRRMLGCFALVLGQSGADTERLAALGAPRTDSVGNLKYAAAPLPVDEAALAALRRDVGARPLWLAASTHPGEETVIADAHRRLRRRWPDLLTMVVPRHAGRGAALAEALARSGLAVVRRSQGAAIAPDCDIYLGDSMGELGLFYRLAGIVFVGGSLVPHGGQNLIEPAQLDNAILHGPHMANFQPIVDEMRSAGATVEVWGGDDLALAVAALIEEPALRAARARAAAAVARARRGVLDMVMERIAPWLAALPDAPAASDHASS